MPSTATGSPDRVPGRRPSLRVALGGLAGALALSLGLAGHAAAIPSAEVVYGPSLPSSLDQYAAPGNVIVVTAEQRNRNPNRIRAWRAKGAIVLAYVNLVDYQQPQDPIEDDLYGGAFPQSWFYPGNLSNFGGRRLLNLEDNSPVATYNGFTGTWGQYAAHWIRDEVIKDGSLFNGVFLDVWGDQLYNVNVGGPGSHWEAGVARWGQEIRNQVGPNIFLVGNNTQTPKTAAPLNGRMWESFSSQPAGSYNDLTGQGTHPGLRYVFPWPQWSRPRLDILWRNEASPSGDTKSMLMSAAKSVSQTGTDIAIGAGDLGTNFPAPFGDGGSAPPGSGVPAPPPAATSPAPSKKATGGSGSAKLSTARRLVLTDFAGGSLAPFAKATSKGRITTKGTPKGGKVALVAGRGAGAFAAIKTTFAAHPHTTVIIRVRVPKLQLPAGRGRALVIVSAADGTSRQVGVIRHRGALHWASWVRTAKGKRVGIVIGKKSLTPRTWVRLRITSDWRGGKRRDVVKVASKPVLRAPVGPLAGKAAQSLTVGLGRSTSKHEAGGVIVRSVAVVGRS
jgi:hypothetical protein